MDLGYQIKKARKQAGLTQRQLAEKAHIATVSIQQYERKVRQPRIDQLQAIANALDMTISQLIDMPDWPGERKLWNSLGESAQQASEKICLADKGKVTLDEKIAAEEILDEIDDLANIADLAAEIDCDYSVRKRINTALNMLTPEGQLIAAERIEELSKIPDYRRITIEFASKPKEPTPVSEGGLENTAECLMKYVTHLSPGQQQMLANQAQQMIEQQKESTASADSLIADDKSSESEPPVQS